MRDYCMTNAPTTMHLRGLTEESESTPRIFAATRESQVAFKKQYLTPREVKS